MHLDTDDLRNIGFAVGEARRVYRESLTNLMDEIDVDRYFPIDITVRVMVEHDVPNDPRSLIETERIEFKSTEE